MDSQILSDTRYITRCVTPDVVAQFDLVEQQLTFTRKRIGGMSFDGDLKAFLDNKERTTSIIDIRFSSSRAVILFKTNEETCMKSYIINFINEKIDFIEVSSTVPDDLGEIKLVDVVDSYFIVTVENIKGQFNVIRRRVDAIDYEQKVILQLTDVKSIDNIRTTFDMGLVYANDLEIRMWSHKDITYNRDVYIASESMGYKKFEHLDNGLYIQSCTSLISNDSNCKYWRTIDLNPDGDYFCTAVNGKMYLVTLYGVVEIVSSGDRGCGVFRTLHDNVVYYVNTDNNCVSFDCNTLFKSLDDVFKKNTLSSVVKNLGGGTKSNGTVSTKNACTEFAKLHDSLKISNANVLRVLETNKTYNIDLSDNNTAKICINDTTYVTFNDNDIVQFLKTNVGRKTAITKDNDMSATVAAWIKIV